MNHNLKKETNWQELYFKAMWLITIALYMTMPSGGLLTQILYYAVHIVTVAVFLITLVTKVNVPAFNIRRLIVIVLLIFVVAVSAAKSDYPISVSVDVMGALGFLEMLMAVYIIDYLDYNESLVRFVYRANIFTAIIFIYLYFTPYAYSSEIIGYLNLGYPNPNMAAIYLMMNIVFFITFAQHATKVTTRLLMVLLGGMLLYLLTLTKSRMCLIMTLFIFAYRLFAPKWRIPKWVIGVIQIIPIVFIFFYTYLYEQGTNVSDTFLGKDLFSGRESFFVEKLAHLEQIWFIGDFGEYHFQNAHNGPLTILLAVGVLGYLLYLWFINSTLRNYSGRIKTLTQMMALIIIFATMIHSSAEAAMMVGGANYSIISATLYWMLKGADDTHGEEATAQ